MPAAEKSFRAERTTGTKYQGSTGLKNTERSKLGRSMMRKGNKWAQRCEGGVAEPARCPSTSPLRLRKKICTFA